MTPPRTILIAGLAIALVSVAVGTLVAGAAPSHAATTATATTPTEPVTAGASPSVADADRPPENFTVEIDVPRRVIMNVTLNYSVSTAGADGNVTATWDFEGVSRNGTTVGHAFPTDGNHTISVTVTDESGTTVTKTTTVSVINLTDDGSTDTAFGIGTIVLLFAGLIGVPMIILLFVAPKALEIITDNL